MPITYPLALPTVTKFGSIRLLAKSTVAASESGFTGSVQIQEYAARYFRAAVSLPAMPRAFAEVWISFLLKLAGQRGTFLMSDPAAATPRGVATGTPLVNGAGQSGIGYATDLITDGWTPNITNIMREGDYIQIGTGSNARLLKNLVDVNSDGTGQATLILWPFLPIVLGAGVADNAPIITQNCVGNFRLVSNEQSWEVAEAVRYGIEFEARGVV